MRGGERGEEDLVENIDWKIGRTTQQWEAFLTQHLQTHDPAIPLLGACPTGMHEHQETHARIFTAAPFVIAPN